MVCYRNIIVTKSSKYVIASHSRHTLVLHLQKVKDRFLPGGCPGGSAGKESTCNAGNPNSIPGSGRSDWEGIDYPLQDSWASLMAQLVKNPPAMQETWVGKILLIREWLSTPVFWSGEFHGLYSPWCHKESDSVEQLPLHVTKSGYAWHRLSTQRAPEITDWGMLSIQVWVPQFNPQIAKDWSISQSQRGLGETQAYNLE